MEKIKKKLDFLLTVILVVCILVTGVLIFQIVQGRQPQLFGYRVFHIVTGSMEPTLEIGGNVVVKEVDASTLEVGDIITFRSRDVQIYGQANTHRIVDIHKDKEGAVCFVTKGDANSREDILEVYAPDIYGKVVFYTNASKWFTLFFDFIHTKEGFVTVVILPLMLAVYFYVKDFVKHVNAAIREQAQQELEQERKAQKEQEVQAEQKEDELK